MVPVGEEAAAAAAETTLVQLSGGRYLEGVMGVRSRPMVWMTLRPHTQSPAQMPTPPYSRSQMGVVMLEVTLLDE